MLNRERVDEFYAGILGIGPSLWFNSIYNFNRISVVLFNLADSENNILLDSDGNYLMVES